MQDASGETRCGSTNEKYGEIKKLDDGIRNDITVRVLLKWNIVYSDSKHYL